MKKVLITGTSGFLGVRAANFFQNSYTVISPKRSDLDIADESAVTEYIKAAEPDYVIHSAAISDIATAQEYSELSDKVNRLSVLYIARGCREVGAKLINMSSDQVYTGNEERFALAEDAVLTPRNLYACQKLAAEQIAAEILPSTVSLRLTWMYDAPHSDIVPNKGLLLSLLSAAKNGEKFRVNRNQLRSVTFIQNVIDNLPKCFELPGGSYNYGSENDLSACELMQYAAKLLGISDVIEPYSGDSQNILIDTGKIRRHGIIFPSAKEGLEQAMLNNCVGFTSKG